MARRFIDLMDRFSRAQSAKDREVFAVRILSKRGRGRALVELPTCEDSSVVAAESTPIACGAGAQAIVNRATGAVSLLPGPTSTPGRAAVFPARVRGTDLGETPPDPNGTLYGIHADMTTSPPTIVVVTYSDADGSPQTEVAATALPSGISNHTPGGQPIGTVTAAGTVILLASRGTFADQLDTLVEVDVRTGSIVSSYNWAFPDRTATGARSNISNVAISGGIVSWVEMEIDDVANEHTWELVSASVGGLSSASASTTLTQPYTNIAAEPIAYPHMRKSATRLFFDGATAHIDANIDYWTGAMLAAGTDRSVDFSGPAEGAYVTGAAPFIDGVVEGDLVGFNLQISPGPPRVQAAVWSGVAQSSFYGHGVIGRKHFGTVLGAGSAFTFYEGNLDVLPGGDFNSVACADADAFTGRTLSPVASCRA